MGESAARKRLREERERTAIEREAAEEDRRVALLAGPPAEMVERFRLNPAYAAATVLRLEDEAAWLRARHDGLVARAEQAEAERDEARARLAEIGETRVEWGVRGGGGTFRVDGEAEARWHTQDPVVSMTVVRRLVGEWREGTEGGSDAQ